MAAHTPISDGKATFGTARAVALTALFALCTMSWQFTHPGYYHKIVEHAVMAERYVSGFAEYFGQGVLLPGWMPDDFGGYGSPIFMYYSPAFYFLAAVPVYLGLSVQLSESAVDLLFLFTGGFGIYLLLRDDFGERAALFGAFFFMALPARIFDLYYTNTPSGRISLGLVPYVMYFMKTAAGGRNGRVAFAGLAFSYGGLILTHIATAYIFTPFAVIYGLLAGGKARTVRMLSVMAVSLIAGACLAGYQFLPVLFMRGDVHIGLMSSMEDYSASRNLLFGTGETSRIPGIAALLKAYGSVVAAQALGVLVLCVVALRDKVLWRAGMMRYSAAAALVCLFMMSSPSLFLWEHVPGLSTWSFPYRLAPLFTLFSALVAGPALGTALEARSASRIGRVSALAAAAVLVAGSIGLIAHSRPMSPDWMAGNRDAVDFVEYLPATTGTGSVQKVHEDTAPALSGEGFTFDLSRRDGQIWTFETTSATGGTVRVRTFYFPGWRACVDGVEVTVRSEERSGAILLDVPPGRHSVELKFTRNRYRKAGAVFSLLAFAGLLVCAYTGASRKETNQELG